jgi:hypothetical protein
VTSGGGADITLGRRGGIVAAAAVRAEGVDWCGDAVYPPRQTFVYEKEE